MKPESFVPLTAAPVAPGPREFRVTVLNGHNHANGNDSSHGSGNGNGSDPGKSAAFQPLETQRPAGFNGTPGAEKKIGEPRVTVQRDGDRVTHLRIQCPCGQIMDLACVYEAPSAP